MHDQAEAGTNPSCPVIPVQEGKRNDMSALLDCKMINPTLEKDEVKRNRWGIHACIGSRRARHLPEMRATLRFWYSAGAGY